LRITKPQSRVGLCGQEKEYELKVAVLATRQQAKALQVNGACSRRYQDRETQEQHRFPFARFFGFAATLGRVREIQHGLSVLSL